MMLCVGTSKDPGCTLEWMVYSAAMMYRYASPSWWEHMGTKTYVSFGYDRQTIPRVGSICWWGHLRARIVT
jgi:hypothetical protein